MAFTKLDSGIIMSTVWRESHHIFKVWMGMLAMVDKDGIVKGAVPGLAGICMVTLEECIEALDKFKSPDPWSRTKEHEGRRIKDIDGGWFLYNHAKYRGPFVAEKKRDVDRLRQQRRRERLKQESVTERDTSRRSVQTDPDTDTDPNTDQDQEKKKTKAKKGYSQEFENFWALDWRGQKVGKADAFREWEKLRRSDELPQNQELHLHISRQCVEKNRCHDAGQFVPEWPHPQRWLKQQRWTDQFEVDHRAPSQPKSKFRQDMDLLDSIINSEDEQPPVKVTGTTEVVG